MFDGAGTSTDICPTTGDVVGAGSATVGAGSATVGAGSASGAVGSFDATAIPGVPGTAGVAIPVNPKPCVASDI
jgi:hypothetical protein